MSVHVSVFIKLNSMKNRKSINEKPDYYNMCHFPDFFLKMELETGYITIQMNSQSVPGGGGFLITKFRKKKKGRVKF